MASFFLPADELAMAGDFENRVFVVSDACQPDMPIVYASPEFCSMTGYDMAEVVGRNCRFLQGEQTNQDTRQALHKALEERRMITADILNYRKDGSHFWNRLRMKPIVGEDDKMMYVLGIQNVVPEEEVRPDPIFDKIVD